MRSNVPGIAPAIAQRRFSIAIELIGRAHQRRGAGTNGALIHRIDVVEVQVQSAGPRLDLFCRVSQLEPGIADCHFGMHDLSAFRSHEARALFRAESALQELDEVGRSIDD